MASLEIELDGVLPRELADLAARVEKATTHAEWQILRRRALYYETVGLQTEELAQVTRAREIVALVEKKLSALYSQAVL